MSVSRIVTTRRHPARRPRRAPRDRVPGAVDVALAEFAALRGEIDNLASAHRATMGLNITVVVALAGFVLTNHADPHLILALPPASGAIGLVYQWYVLHAKKIGDYINEHLRPMLVEHTGDDRVLGWEHQLRTTVYPTVGSNLSGRLSYLLLFPAVPVVSLAAAVPLLDSGWYVAAWVVGAALSATQITIWARQARSWVCWT
ncbi:hypothetical protein ACH4OY_28905 [Micromonospora rubida]|uniref:Sensor domain-containing protein n=1 Tax=Micromonospora rubida TaxID=2697657 RepID=A0ABW7SUD2_9ACTN